jgi:antitoxin MazE
MATITRKRRPAKSPGRKARSRQFASQRHSTVARWGNSLGLRIPQGAVEELKLVAGDRVMLKVHDGAITIRPVHTRKKWTEAELLKGITPEIVGGEIDWGGPVGKEVW